MIPNNKVVSFKHEDNRLSANTWLQADARMSAAFCLNLKIKHVALLLIPVIYHGGGLAQLVAMLVGSTKLLYAGPG